MIKVCKRCGDAKDYSEWYILKKTGKPAGSYCKSCRSAMNRKNRKVEAARVKLWREANPDKYSEQQQRSGAKRAQRARTNAEYAEQLRKQKYDNSRKNFVSEMLNRAKRRALLEELPFELTADNLVIPDKCPILGVPLVLGTKGNYRYTYSLDKKDPSLGYTVANTRVVSMLANTMKNDATREELEAFAKNILTYLDN